MRKTILSLCDHSGVWSQPYQDAGYKVIRVDLRDGGDVRLLKHEGPVHGILAAPPCTEFAVSGARWWAGKTQQQLLEGLAVVDACLRIIATRSPRWWALENPVGRLRDYIGPSAFTFNPCDYGDAYTKRTLIWGNCNQPHKNPVSPQYIIGKTNGKKYSPIHYASGSQEKKTGIRSQTPPGFARAFFHANP